MTKYLIFIILPFLVVAEGCTPGSRIIACSAVDGAPVTCGVKNCDADGRWEKVSSSSSSSSSVTEFASFSLPTTAACQTNAHSTICLKNSAVNPFECVRQICDASTGHWGAEAKIPVKKRTTLKLTGGCLPGMVTRGCTKCDVGGFGSCKCFRRSCGADGVWGREIQIGEKESFLPTSSSTALGLKGSCFPPGAELLKCIQIDDGSPQWGPLQCVRQVCDPSTDRWGPEEKVKVTGEWKLSSGPLKKLKMFGHECVPGSYVKECSMIEDYLLQCITTVCDWNGRWIEESREIFNR